MTQPQRQADVHQDKLYPPNKHYALMDANKKIDLDNPLCPKESKILANILQNHLLRFSIVASSSVPWIYLGQFWHTLKEDGSKYRLSFTKLIISHYITAYPKISRRVRNKYHNIEHDEMVKSIFNSGKNKAGVGMKIPSWMITDKMKLTKNYRMYAAVFRVDVPTTHHDKLEALEKVEEHLIAEEIEKLVEGTKNVENVKVDNSISHNQNDPDTRLEPRSYKESPKVEKTADVSQSVNVIGIYWY
ncbi:hypothetical protein Tco_0861462 [Tanacetum coccineum]|uniref:Uncharacterized protein n=1 Tax=Tanacetum coccineum TaxID=301880 RepID=A0ABQ5BI00_9ASTR